MRSAHITSVAAGSFFAFFLTACTPTIPQAPQEAQINIQTHWENIPAHPMEKGDGIHFGQDWWREFGDDELNALVEQALAHNARIGIAITQVDAARAQLEQADAAARPALNLGVSAQAARSLSGTGGRTTRTAEPNLQVAWEADLWGKLKALSRAGELQLSASEADLDAVRLSVTASTVEAYIGLKALQEQLSLARQTEADRLKAVGIAKDKESLGYSAAAQTSQVVAELESVRQSVQQLELAIAQQSAALALLIGSDTPGQPPALSKIELSALQKPSIPEILPSELLERRPDIATAADHLAAGDAILMARKAAFLPQLNLSAMFGGIYSNTLNYDPIRVWSLGGSLLAPLFDGNRLQSQFDLAVAQRDQAGWAYRDVVLTALSEVEMALQTDRLLEQQMQTTKQRCAQLEETLSYANDRVDAGYTSLLEALDAQRNLYQCQQSEISLQQQAINNTVTLIKAIGGGWLRPEPVSEKPA